MTHYVYTLAGARVGCKGGPLKREVLGSDMCIALHYAGQACALCPACTQYLKQAIESATRAETSWDCKCGALNPSMLRRCCLCNSDRPS